MTGTCVGTAKALLLVLATVAEALLLDKAADMDYRYFQSLLSQLIEMLLSLTLDPRFMPLTVEFDPVPLTPVPVAAINVVYGIPAELVIVTSVPLAVALGIMDVVDVLLTACLSELIADSMPWTLDWYSEGMAVRKGGGVAAVRADCTIELMSPVMLATEAADWTATPTATTMDGGIKSETI